MRVEAVIWQCNIKCMTEGSPIRTKDEMAQCSHIKGSGQRHSQRIVVIEMQDESGM